MKITNVSIITGFLGVGKTTLIKDLLDCKPINENWAVIVNEFGKVGVDALFLQNPSVIVKQVAGGCACCAAQLPFQIALNQLLKSTSLDRIFIEPSGLGHADGLAEVLNQAQYKNWLRLNSTITLVDPMQFEQSKYRDHEIYQRQLKAADALYFTKCSDASDEAINNAVKYANAKKLVWQKDLDNYLDSSLNSLEFISWIDSAKKQRTLLSQPTSRLTSFSHINKNNDEFFQAAYEPSLTETFSLSKLVNILQDEKFQRVKGIIATDQGIKSINTIDEKISISDYNGPSEKILEVISTSPITTKQVQLIFSEALVILALRQIK